MPNIAILPTSELPRVSENISNDIGVDIQAILSSLAGSAAKLRQNTGQLSALSTAKKQAGFFIPIGYN